VKAFIYSELGGGLTAPLETIASCSSGSMRKMLIWTGPLPQPLPQACFSDDSVCRQEPFSKNIVNTSVRKQLCCFSWACAPWILSEIVTKQRISYKSQLEVVVSFHPRAQQDALERQQISILCPFSD